MPLPTAGPHAPPPASLRWRWALYDTGSSAYATVVQTFIFAAYFTREVAPDTLTGTAAWGQTLAVAGLLVALGSPVLGALADASGRHRRYLMLCSAVASLSTAALWWVVPDSPMLPALLLVGAGSMAVELAGVFYNALLGHVVPPQSMGRWSGYGWAAGYAGGLACLTLALVLFIQPGWPSTEQARHVRACFLLAGAWQLLFALPLLTARGLRPAASDVGVAASLRSLVGTLRQLPHYPGVGRFLLARMVYTDGLATVFAFGGVYAAGTFGMDAGGVLRFGIALNVAAGLGALLLARADDVLGSKPTIVISLCGLLAFGTALLLVRSLSAFWVCGLGLGVFVGPVQAAGRTLLARLTPAAQRTQFFGLFAFSGKATAFLGPLLVGTLTQFSGSQRVGMSAVVALLAAGLVLLRGVPRGAASGAASG